jgi:hypothetical protein
MNDTLIQLEQHLASAAIAARDLVAEAVNSNSPFAAALRSALDHAADLLEKHQAWVKDNAPGK